MLGKLPKDWALGPKTPLNATISGERVFATLSLSLEEVKQIAHDTGTTLSDAVLAICSGGLRCDLEDHGGIPEKPLNASVRVSLRHAGDAEMNTQATLTLASLATNISDPIKRLLAIHRSSSASKKFIATIDSPILTDFPSSSRPRPRRAKRSALQSGRIPRCPGESALNNPETAAASMGAGHCVRNVRLPQNPRLGRN